MSPPPKSEQKVPEEKPLNDGGKIEGENDEKKEETVDQNEMKSQEEIEMKAEKQDTMQAAAELWFCCFAFNKILIIC